MFDVRNAISTILDRYTLADIVEITLRKYCRDEVTPPFLHRSIALSSISSEKQTTLRGVRRGVASSRVLRHRGSRINNHSPKRVGE